MAGGEMLRSGFFCCEGLCVCVPVTVVVCVLVLVAELSCLSVGLPCLLNLTSTGDILIHGIPKLQHLITVPYAPLLDSRYTFPVLALALVSLSSSSFAELCTRFKCPETVRLFISFLRRRSSGCR